MPRFFIFRSSPTHHAATTTKQYAPGGGRLCIVGEVATHDEWLKPRAKVGLGELLPAHVSRVTETGDCVSAVRQCCGGRFSLSVEAAPGLCSELTEQRGRRLVHLVNYHPEAPVTNAVVNLLLLPGTTARAVRLSGPEHERSTEVAFEQHADSITFSVPAVNVYEVAVVDLQRQGSQKASREGENY